MRRMSCREFSETVIIAADALAERASRNFKKKAVRLWKYGITIGVRSWMTVIVGSKVLMGRDAPWGFRTISAPSRRRPWPGPATESAPCRSECATGVVQIGVR